VLGPSLVVGLDVGGTSNNVTVLSPDGEFLIDHLLELPSRVLEGPEAALQALQQAYDLGLSTVGAGRDEVRAVGLDTPGPASATGVISRRGATNFSAPVWRGFDIRTALEGVLERPVVYSNDGNAAAMYAHYSHFGPLAPDRSSISAIVGTGLGGGVIEAGRIVAGGTGMGGELGHVHVPAGEILEEDQPVPVCNCGFASDVESYASLTGIRKNLLPYWLTRYPDHPLAHVAPAEGARQIRHLAERDRDPMALAIFAQQAKATCSRSPPTSPTPTPSSSGAASWRPIPGSATGTSTRSGNAPRCARSRRPTSSSPWCATSTWRGHAGRPSPPSASSAELAGTGAPAGAVAHTRADASASARTRAVFASQA
jgi:glucokinase